MLARRQENANRSERGIPRMMLPIEQERRVPQDLVIHHLLPSFARHLATKFAQPGKVITSIKMYRVLHRITFLNEFEGFDLNEGRPVMPMDPYTPSLYLPYFQGDFDREGRLKDSTDPLLYWMVPIYNDPKRNNPFPDTLEEYRENIKRHGISYYFTETVSRHAGCERPKERGRRP